MLNLLLFASTGTIILFVVLAILLVLLAVFFSLVPIGHWFKALVSGSYVSMSRLIGMKLRKLPVAKIVNAYIMAKKAGIVIDINEIETHEMAGGDINKVINALISAHSARIALSNEDAKAIDLAGRDILESVRDSVDPKVIEIPPVSAIAKDGIELKVKALVTVRMNIGRLVGGAGEETVAARVGQGIVTTVGSAESYLEVLENPDMISETVKKENDLEAGTAFEVLSLDIADIDVGRNVGAQLLIDKAEADKNIAQAKAEERKSMAIALEQEMKAKTQEMKAVVLEAEAEVPKAMADAFRKGNLGIMDYYKMQNVVADTNMRNTIAGVDDPNSAT